MVQKDTVFFANSVEKNRWIHINLGNKEDKKNLSFHQFSQPEKANNVGMYHVIKLGNQRKQILYHVTRIARQRKWILNTKSPG
jgi:hypothetical protein